MSFRLAFLFLISLFGLIHCQPAEMKHAYTNKLIDETSPYLLQHAHNPVNWHAWNDEALAKARDEKKLIIISIGYSSCHWCHVMEHESFADSAVAAIMNEHFVNIKVDREERPDIDDIYMTACQLSSGSGCGWPLNSFALPDGRPVWAGTYFPRDRWVEILAYFQKTYKDEPQKLYDYAAQLVAGVQYHGLDTLLTGDEPAIKKEDAVEVSKLFLSGMDPRLGGRRGAPKFPMPNNVQYLMHYAKRYGDQEAATQALTTLDNMMGGGIYDQIEGGFARYSTDDKWLVPHFEKMLYDNGQLISLYANAFAWTGNQAYLDIVTQTIDFANTYWLDPSGGYYSSFDADSEGEEGKYYVWSFEELEQLLPDAKERDIFFTYYDIQQNGNWEEGKNILYRSTKTDVIANQHNLSAKQVHTSIQEAHHKILAARKKRIAPGLDDKILASWNGLMLQGLIDAYKASGNEKYHDQAKQNGHFIKKHLIKEGNRLDRNYKNGKTTINGFLDDYAAVIQGMMSLYQTTFDISWLETANGLAAHVIEHFDSGTGGLFYFTSDLDPPLVARRMDLSDNVIPSSNSMMARNLLALGELMYNQEYIERAKLMMSTVWPMILRDKQPSFYSNWCQLMLNIIQPPYEVAIVGDQYKEPLMAMQQTYQPDALYLGGKDDTTLPLLEDKLSPGETLIYVCQNKVCKMPTPDVTKALSLLKEK